MNLKKINTPFVYAEWSREAKLRLQSTNKAKLHRKAVLKKQQNENGEANYLPKSLSQKEKIVPNDILQK